jgi:hypothetical protein
MQRDGSPPKGGSFDVSGRVSNVYGLPSKSLVCQTENKFYIVPLREALVYGSEA